MQVEVPDWILVVGGAGIVCGLALFSSNISRCLGVQVAKITFARGFSAEFGTAITVAIASRYGAGCGQLSTRQIRSLTRGCVGHSGAACVNSCITRKLPVSQAAMLTPLATVSTLTGLPVSTTQTITGALIAIGLTEGLKGVNWRTVAKVGAAPCRCLPNLRTK